MYISKYNSIYNPKNLKKYSIFDKNGILLLKKYIKHYLGGKNPYIVYTNPLKNKKIRLIYENEEAKDDDIRNMIQFITQWQWKMYKIKENDVRLCTYGVHIPYCPHFGLTGKLESTDKIIIDIPNSLNSFLQRGKSEKIPFKIYEKVVESDNDTPLTDFENEFYWNNKKGTACYNSK